MSAARYARQEAVLMEERAHVWERQWVTCGTSTSKGGGRVVRLPQWVKTDVRSTPRTQGAVAALLDPTLVHGTRLTPMPKQAEAWAGEDGQPDGSQHQQPAADWGYPQQHQQHQQQPGSSQPPYDPQQQQQQMADDTQQQQQQYQQHQQQYQQQQQQQQQQHEQRQYEPQAGSGFAPAPW